VKNIPNEDVLGPLELKLGRLLFAGVTTSAVCLAAGLVLTLAGVSPAAANVILTAGLVILMILVAVAVIDWISGKLRFAIIGKRAVV